MCVCEGRVGRDGKRQVKPGGGVHMSEEVDDSQQQCVEGLVSKHPDDGHEGC